MAWLERDARTGFYKVGFRLGNRRIKKSLRTDSLAEAQATVGTVNDTRVAVERGWASIHPGVDAGDYIFSGGRLSAPLNIRANLQFHELFDAYFSSLPDGVLEQSTVSTMRIHERQLCRILGRSSRVGTIEADDLQRFIRKRSEEPGRRGRKVKPTTIWKALVTFRTVWNWGVAHNHLQGPFPKFGLKSPKSVQRPCFQTWKEVEQQIARGGLSRTEAVWITRTLERMTDDVAYEQAGSGDDHTLVFTPDGTRLIAGGSSFDVDLTDPDRPRLRQSTSPVPGGGTGRSSIAFSPDGRWTIRVDGSRLHVIDAADPHRVVHEAVPDPLPMSDVTKLMLSADGRRVAATTADGITHLWNGDWNTNGGPRLTPYSQPVPGTGGPVVLSPDGNELVSGGKLYRLAELECTPVESEIAANGLPVFSPEGDWLASLTSHAGCFLYRRTGTTWKLLHRLNPPLADVTAASFSPDSRILVAGDGSGRVHTWDLSVDPPVERNAPAVASRPERVAFSPDGRTLATWGLDGGTVWDLTATSPRPTPVVCRDLGGSPGFVSYSHDSQWVAFPGGVWGVNRPSPDPDVRIPYGHKAYFSAAEPTLILLAIAGESELQATWCPWTISSRGTFVLHNETHEFRRHSTVSDLGGTGTLDALGLCAARNRAVSHVKRTIRVWELDRPQSPRSELVAPESLGEHFFCRLSSDGRWLFGFDGGGACIAQLWDLDDPNRQPRPIPRAPVHVAEFLEGSDLLIVGQRDTLSVIEVVTGAVQREWVLPRPVIWIAAHPDGRHFATVTANHLVQIWRLP